MTQKQFDEKLDDLTRRLLTMSHKVEELVDGAVDLAVRREGADPEQIWEGDEEIDRAREGAVVSCRFTRTTRSRRSSGGTMTARRTRSIGCSRPTAWCGFRTTRS